MVATWMAPCSVKASGGERRPPQLEVATDLLVKTLGGHAVEHGQLGIEQHALATQHANRLGNMLGCYGCLARGHPRTAYDARGSRSMIATTSA